MDSLYSIHFINYDYRISTLQYSQGSEQTTRALTPQPFVQVILWQSGSARMPIPQPGWGQSTPPAWRTYSSAANLWYCPYCNTRQFNIQQTSGTVQTDTPHSTSISTTFKKTIKFQMEVTPCNRQHKDVWKGKRSTSVTNEATKVKFIFYWIFLSSYLLLPQGETNLRDHHILCAMVSPVPMRTYPVLTWAAVNSRKWCTSVIMESLQPAGQGSV
jgi:hypothetical protein